MARLPVNFVSSEDSTVIKETTIDLKKDDAIVFWSDMDMEYEGDVGLRFRIQVLKDGQETGRMEIDPTDKNVMMGESKVSIMNKQAGVSPAGM